MASKRRLFAGPRVRQLRARLAMSQAELAQRLSISVSYLSQIESGVRPLTSSVLAALARVFPVDWSAVAPEDDEALLIEAVAACDDASVPGERIDDARIPQALRQHPLLMRRMIAIHAAYRRSLEQLRALDDRFESVSEGGQLPWEEVRDWFQAEGNYVDAIDRAAEEIAGRIELVADPAGAITARLQGAHGIAVRAGGEVMRHFDADARRLSIDGALPSASRLFLMAHQLMRLELPDVIAEVAAAAPLRHEGSRVLLSAGLANYAAGALLMPYAAFRAAAREMRHDIDRLRQRFGTSFEQTCHRLSTLQRPGARGVPFFFCRVDMAGNITKRHSATRLQFARFGGACPLWIVHEAVAIPDRILVQLAETPDGTRYVSMAKGLVKPTGSYLRPARRYAVALGCEIEHAGEFIYADGIELHGRHSATPIGSSCRICPRADCDQRAFPPAGRPLAVDLDRRDTVPYAFD